MNLNSAAMTDPGIRREDNEDNVWAQVFTTSEGKPVGMLIVCDGMGGHLGGQHASYWAIETVKYELSGLFCPGDPRETYNLSEEPIDGDGKIQNIALKPKELESIIDRAIQKANDVVYEYAQQRPERARDAGTTLTMAIVYHEKAVIANVGDSRTYLMRDHHLRQITRDHSLVASLVASGQLEPDELYSHPQRSMIYRSLGQKRLVQIDFFHEDLQRGDCILCCSDGLWEMIQDDAIIGKLIEQASSLDQACTDLIKAANTAGGEDNISVVLAQYS